MKIRALSVGHIASTTTITLILLLLGSTCYLLLGAAGQASRVSEELRFSFFLEDSISSEQLGEIKGQLSRDKDVSDVVYLSKAEAAAEFAKEIGTDFQSLLAGENPLPASLEVDVRQNVDVKKFEARYRSLAGVEQIIYPHVVAQALGSSIAQITIFAIGFGLILIFISLVVIHNTLRLEVAAQRSAIMAMREQGMWRKHIRQPFMSRALIQGALSGVLASAILMLATDSLRVAMPSVYISLDISVMGVICASMVMVGILLCTLFTYFSVNRQL